MTFSHFNRRLHLYLGLFLLPWLFMYGISSIPFAHGSWFQPRDEAQAAPLWTVRLKKDFDRPVPDDPHALREFGRAVLKEFGVEAPNFGVYRPNRTSVNINAFSFLQATRLIYSLEQKSITVEDRAFRFNNFLTGMHARGGFEQDGFLPKSWGVLVDVVSVSMILWILTGLYLWWGVPGHRRWGWVAILSGVGSFVVFVVCL